MKTETGFYIINIVRDSQFAKEIQQENGLERRRSARPEPIARCKEYRG